jgi:hypothetical protein
VPDSHRPFTGVRSPKDMQLCPGPTREAAGLRSATGLTHYSRRGLDPRLPEILAGAGLKKRYLLGSSFHSPSEFPNSHAKYDRNDSPIDRLEYWSVARYLGPLLALRHPPETAHRPTRVWRWAGFSLGRRSKGRNERPLPALALVLIASALGASGIARSCQPIGEPAGPSQN